MYFHVVCAVALKSGGRQSIVVLLLIERILNHAGADYGRRPNPNRKCQDITKDPAEAEFFCHDFFFPWN